MPNETEPCPQMGFECEYAALAQQGDEQLRRISELEAAIGAILRALHVFPEIRNNGGVNGALTMAERAVEK